jgi:hypothetical protein
MSISVVECLWILTMCAQSQRPVHVKYMVTCLTCLKLQCNQQEDVALNAF